MENNANNRMTNASDWHEIVRQKVAAIEFGLVQIVVHEGRVVQIECTEKTRVPPPSSRETMTATR